MKKEDKTKVMPDQIESQFFSDECNQNCKIRKRINMVIEIVLGVGIFTLLVIALYQAGVVK